MKINSELIILLEKIKLVETPTRKYVEIDWDFFKDMFVEKPTSHCGRKKVVAKRFVALRDFDIYVGSELVYRGARGEEFTLGYHEIDIYHPYRIVLELSYGKTGYQLTAQKFKETFGEWTDITEEEEYTYHDYVFLEGREKEREEKTKKIETVKEESFEEAVLNTQSEIKKKEMINEAWKKETEPLF